MTFVDRLHEVMGSNSCCYLMWFLPLNLQPSLSFENDELQNSLFSIYASVRMLGSAASYNQLHNSNRVHSVHE